MAESARSVTGSTTVAGVIGSPVRHSLSPVIHNAAFAAAGLDWVYVAFELAPGEARSAIEAMRSLGIAGLSVTMPHKTAVAAAVDAVDDDAAALGAVNCVAWDGDVITGHNTDGPGFVDAVRSDLGLDLSGARVAVLGAGGAARAVVRAAARAGASDVVVVNRTAANARHAALLAPAIGRTGPVEAVADVDVIVNATPLGMGDNRELAVPSGLLRADHAVIDLVYEPRVTPLIRAARAVGADATNGLSMLIHQAAHAFERWTGTAAPLGSVRAAVERATS